MDKTIINYFDQMIIDFNYHEEVIPQSSSNPIIYNYSVSVTTKSLGVVVSVKYITIEYRS